MSSSRLLSLIAASVLLTSAPAVAFSVSSSPAFARTIGSQIGGGDFRSAPSTGGKASTSIQYRNGDEHEEGLEVQKPDLIKSIKVPATNQPTPARAIASDAPCYIDLPRHTVMPSTLKILASSEPMLGKVERVLGRIAMLSALVIFAVELASGMSVPEQISAIM